MRPGHFHFGEVEPRSGGFREVDMGSQDRNRNPEKSNLEWANG